MLDPADEGFHNIHWERAQRQFGTYRDCSTAFVIPSIADMAPRVAVAWMALIKPTNHKCAPVLVEGYEVGHAYNRAIEIIQHDQLMSTWPYMLTMETDNIPPPDGLVKLLEDIESGPYDAVGAIYFGKHELGPPMCFGKPGEDNFGPWLPERDTVTPCRGIGMGFSLFRMSVFDVMPKPWFQTEQDWNWSTGASVFSQDLAWAARAEEYGLKIACSTRVRVGHMDRATGRIW